MLIFIGNDMGIGDWGMGIGDLGIGDWAQTPIPNPPTPTPTPQSQSPIPNPQSPRIKNNQNKIKKLLINNKVNNNFNKKKLIY